MPPSSRLAGLTMLGCVSVGFGALAPALAGIQDAFGGGAGLSALLVGSFGAGRLLIAVPAGLAVDRLGAGRVALGGAAVFIGGSLVGAIAPTFWLVAAGRFLQGVGCALTPAGVLAWPMAGAVGGRAGGSMALYQSGFTLGGAAGAALAGPLVAASDWRASFLLCVAAGLLALPFGRGLASAGRAAVERSRVPAARLGAAAVLAIVLVMLPNGLAAFDRFAATQLVLPLFAAGPVGLDPASIGLMLGVQTALATALLGPAGWACTRWGTRRVVLGSALLSAFGIAALPYCREPLSLWAATLVYGAGVAVLGVAGGLYVFELPGQSTGRLVGLYRLSTDVTQVVGPLVVGAALERYDFVAVLLAIAIFNLSALLGLAAPARRRRPCA